jgi:hypothetical protein
VSDLADCLSGAIEGPDSESPLLCELLSICTPGCILLGPLTGNTKVVNSEASALLARKLRGFSKFLGLPIDGFEEQSMALLWAIESKRRKHGDGSSRPSSRCSVDPTPKGLGN